MGVGLFGMKGGHGAVDEMKDQGDEDDEEAAEKEFAGLGLVRFGEQVVHGEIDTSGEALVADRWGVLITEGTEKGHREHTEVGDASRPECSGECCKANGEKKRGRLQIENRKWLRPRRDPSTSRAGVPKNGRQEKAGSLQPG